MKNETEFKKKVLAFLRSGPGAFVYPPTDSHRAGVPDLIFIYEGMPAAVELKMKGNTATKLQREWLWDFYHAGGSSFILTAVPDRGSEPFLRSTHTECHFICESFETPKGTTKKEMPTLDIWWMMVEDRMRERFYDQSQKQEVKRCRDNQILKN